jgi:vancomycin resistance protein VanW
VHRRIVEVATSRVLENRVIATNRRRVLSGEEMGRTCLTCGEEACHRRVEVRP